MAKAKKDQFCVAIGFNIPDPSNAGEELRYEPGEDAPNIVQENDFEPAVWANLVDAGAITSVAEVERPQEEQA
jgi:hypothetical protein